MRVALRGILHRRARSAAGVAGKGIRLARRHADRIAVRFADVLHFEGKVVSDGKTFALDQVTVGKREDRVSTVRKVVRPWKVRR